MYLKQETKDNISKIIENALGISYEEFEQLDFDEQQELIAMHKKKIFTKVKKGKRIMIGSGEHSCLVRAGISPEEEKQELNNKIDDAIYSRPVALVKKLQRRIRHK